MKRYKAIRIFITIMVCILTLCSCSSHNHEDMYNEGVAKLVEETTWFDSNGQSHTANFYTNGRTATDVSKEINNVKLNHIMVDDIPLYEMYSLTENNKKIVFFFHGQESRKEEYLPEMLNYAEAGYVCVTVDLEGYGERVVEEALMSLQITVDTANDIDTLLEYYKTVPYANPEKFAIVGMSQGGSIAYWYAAYGKSKPSALVVGSSTPDYKYQKDFGALENGIPIEPIWTKEEIILFTKQNNPIGNIDKLIELPILSGNGIDDQKISFKGAEFLEKEKIKAGIDNSYFYYYENVGHDLSDEFMVKVIPFLNKEM